MRIGSDWSTPHFQKVARKWLGEYKGRNPLRPHSLRAAFRTILGDAGMDRDVVEFFMGHKLPEQLRVYHSRSRDGWRAIYAKYMQYIEPMGVQIS
ncbi:MAG: tyrosine-type recombinase/integrase [Candidatus Bathyarchaeia archaeon]